MATRQKFPRQHKDTRIDDLAASKVGGKKAFIPTRPGLFIEEDQPSLKQHERGTVLPGGLGLREKITHFDLESIPGQIVHIKGSHTHSFSRVIEPGSLGKDNKGH